MRKIREIKFAFGLILLSFAIFSAVIFFLESFWVFDRILYFGMNVSNFKNYPNSAAFSNMPIFLGLCGLSGAYLLGSISSPRE